MTRISNAYRQLASSVLNTALSDKKTAEKKLLMNPENEKEKALLEDCNTFFQSEWCEVLLSLLDIEKSKYLEVAYGR